MTVMQDGVARLSVSAAWFAVRLSSVWPRILGKDRSLIVSLCVCCSNATSAGNPAVPCQPAQPAVAIC